jgi:hypothetical protein
MPNKTFNVSEMWNEFDKNLDEKAISQPRRSVHIVDDDVDDDDNDESVMPWGLMDINDPVQGHQYEFEADKDYPLYFKKSKDRHAFVNPFYVQSTSGNKNNCSLYAVKQSIENYDPAEAATMDVDEMRQNCITAMRELSRLFFDEGQVDNQELKLAITPYIRNEDDYQHINEWIRTRTNKKGIKRVKEAVEYVARDGPLPSYVPLMIAQNKGYQTLFVYIKRDSGKLMEYLERPEDNFILIANKNNAHFESVLMTRELEDEIREFSRQQLAKR